MRTIMKSKVIGYTTGVFDMFHIGHLNILKRSKEQCDYLIVALHCCPNYKNPIQTIYERYMQLRAVKFVDEIIPYTDVNDAKNMLLSLNYDIYFLGEDHRDNNWECCDVIRDLGKDVVYLSRKHGFSSTYVKDRLLNQ